MHNARWKCHACGSDFKEPEKWYSGSSIGHAPDALICPYCKDDYIEEAERCSYCGKAMFDNELTEGFCEECLEDFAYSDYAHDYIVHDSDIYEDFARYMRKRIGGDAG